MAKHQAGKKSVKHLQIDKAQARIALTVAGLAFVLVFSIVLARALWLQRAFQTRVIQEKEVAVNQLEENLEAAERLELSYRAFTDVPTNAIGGISDGDGDRDGDNARLVLDALPSQYDYPALITSIEKILEDNGYSIEAITGTDDLVEQGEVEDSQPVEMPFEFRVVTTPTRSIELLRTLERSIRPFNASEIRISVSEDDSVELRMNAFSYFQPEARLTITTKEVN